jgi:CHASE2 domain-containing sensor protein
MTRLRPLSNHRRYDWANQPGRRRIGMAGLIALVVVGCALILHYTDALQALELKSVDIRFEIRGARGRPAGLVIVGIDPQTFSQLDLQWPFPRSMHALLIDRLRHDGAKVIVYDVQFTEPTTPTNDSRRAAQAAITEDNALIDAVGRAGNVVLASSEVGGHGETMIFGGGATLARLNARAGAAIFPPDPDGVDRRMIFNYRGLRTLGVVGAEAATGRRISTNALGGGGAWIDFAGPAGTIAEVPFAAVLRNEVRPSTFANKAVVVGATASNLQDVHATPFDNSGLMSGSEITANAILTAENDFPLRTSSGVVVVLLIAMMGAFAPLAGLRLAPAEVLGGGLALGLAYCVAAQLSFDSGLVVPVGDPLVALLLGCAAAIAVDSFGERKRLQALGRALGPLRTKDFQFFLSYRRSQSQWPATLLYRALTERFGSSSVFMDKRAIDAGDIWPQEIEEASTTCSVMLVLIGPGWIGVGKPDGTRRLDDPDDWVRREVLAGLESAESAVVPVLHDGAAMPGREDLPGPLERLADCNAIVFTGDDIDSELDRLIASVQSGRIRSRLRQRPSARRDRV